MDDNLPCNIEEITNRVNCLAALLKERSLKISVAESCTGGLLAKLLTDLPGSSDYFLAGVVAYSNDAKTALLGVSPGIIHHNGAVSSEVAEAMAEGMLKAVGCDMAVSVTGIAGPEGGTAEKPAGTVYLGLADKNGCSTRLLRLSGDRRQVRIASAFSAIDWMCRHILDYPSPKKTVSP